MASIYTTAAGTTAVNSVTGDSTDGSFTFYVDEFDTTTSPQEYDMTLSKSGYVSKTYPNIDLTLIPPVYTQAAIDADLTKIGTLILLA